MLVSVHVLLLGLLHSVRSLVGSTFRASLFLLLLLLFFCFLIEVFVVFFSSTSSVVDVDGVGRGEMTSYIVVVDDMAVTGFNISAFNLYICSKHRFASSNFASKRTTRRISNAKRVDFNRRSDPDILMTGAEDAPPDERPLLRRRRLPIK